MSRLVVETIDAEAELAPIAQQWDELVRSMPRPSPWLLHAWISSWWRHFGSGRELAVHVARRDGRLVAALPLVLRRRLGVRVGEFLGAHESALADLLVAPGEPTETAVALARLARERSDALDVYGLPAGSRLERALDGRLRLVPRSNAPVLDLSPGWGEAYRRATSSKRRNLHGRRRRQLAALGDVAVEVARSAEQLLPALEDAFTLHDRRWRGRPDLSTFGTAEGRTFHRDALRAVAAEGVARIVTLRVGGRAVAFHYFFLLDGTMYVHRLAFDPDLARFSPGLVNTLDAIEAAAEEGARRVEFLGGAERYKLELTETAEPLQQGLAAFSTRGLAYVLARLAALRGRRVLKRSERLRRLYYGRARR